MDTNSIVEFRRRVIERVASIEWKDSRAVLASLAIAQELFDPDDELIVAWYKHRKEGGLEDDVIDIVRQATYELLGGE